MSARTLPGNWPIRFTPEAAADVRRLFDSDERMYHGMMAGLALLVQETDPLHPRSPVLDVCRTHPVARGCFRVKVRGFDWRVVLRIMETRGGYTYHVLPDEDLCQDADAQYLQAVMVDTRDGATYEIKLARAWETASV